jgi:hypothetical protein
MERKVAKLLGGVRNPLSGGTGRHTRGDIIHPSLYVECKLRQKLSIWAWYKDTAEKAKVEGKTPILVIKEKSKKGELVVLDIKDFVALIGENKNEKVRALACGQGLSSTGVLLYVLSI